MPLLYCVEIPILSTTGENGQGMPGHKLLGKMAPRVFPWALLQGRRIPGQESIDPAGLGCSDPAYPTERPLFRSPLSP